MLIRKLVLHNFGPFYGRVSIDMSPSSEKGERPIILFGGLNGGGKTTFLDALLLALYGQRARCSKRGSLPYKDFLQGCINDRVSPADGASLELEFDYVTHEGVRRFRILRSWQQRGKSMVENMEVYCNGEPDPALTDTWPQRIETLLPLGLSNLFFFDGEQVRSLAGENEPTPEVKHAIRTLLGLELPAQLIRDLQIISHRSKKAFSDQTTAEKIDELERALDRLKQERASVKISIAEYRNEERRAQRSLERAKSQFESQGGELFKRRDQLMQERAQVRQEQESARDQLRTLAEGALPLMQISGLLKRTLLRAEKELSSRNSAVLIDLLQTRDQQLLDLLKGTGASPKILEVATSFLDQNVQEHQRDLQQETYLNTSTEDVSLLHEIHTHRLPTDLSIAQQQLSIIQRTTAKLDHINHLLESAAAPSDVQLLLAGVEQATSRIAKAQAEINALSVDLDGFEQQIAANEHKLSIALNQAFCAKEAQATEARLISSSERVVAVMEKYRERLKANKLTELERLVTDRFRHLARKEDLINCIEIDGENFSLLLYDEEGKRIDRGRLSAGEQQLLAVSFLWGLAEASGRSLPVVIDTPLARMDSTHRTNLVERYFPHVSHQVIVLSTDVEIDQVYYRKLIKMGAIDRSYHIQYNPAERKSKVVDGYFWNEEDVA